MEATPLGAVGDRLNFIFYCGKLGPSEIESIGAPELPPDVRGWEFVDPRYFRAEITPYQRRCLDIAVAALSADTGTPYLRNGLRINARVTIPA